MRFCRGEKVEYTIFGEWGYQECRFYLYNDRY